MDELGPSTERMKCKLKQGKRKNKPAHQGSKEKARRHHNRQGLTARGDMNKCPTCEKYKRFIQAMIKEWGRYNSNKTAQYYKGQCEKILKQTGPHGPDK